MLREHGAEIVRFSPLNDASLPADLDALYLGGGYPELHAERLSSNRTMLEDVRAFAASGRPVYAGAVECCIWARSSTSVTSYAMAGVLPLSMQMTHRSFSLDTQRLSSPKTACWVARAR